LKNTKFNLKFCEEQVRYLHSTRFFDRLTDMDLMLFRDALMVSFDTQTDAQFFISTWLSDHADYPHISDIHAAGRLAKQAAINAMPPPCDLCREFNGRVLVIGTHRGVKVSGLGFCQCPRGRSLSASFDKFKADGQREERELERAATPEEAAALTDIFPAAAPKEPVH
jgi:hypothetical protein